jgi:Protein of unknown function (DUF3891)
MILRPHRSGTLLIGQPAHAWLSGRLADAWAWPFHPRDEVRLAALQHDIGMAAWDAAPELDPRTGLPFSFTSMPRATHAELWGSAARLVVAQSPYAALLVSLHGTGLYDRYVSERERSAEPVRGFLERERAWQRALVAALDADPDEVERNAALLRCWDWLSLFVCTASAESGSFADAPGPDGPVSLTARMPVGDAERVTVSPWPFGGEGIRAEIDGRVLAREAETQEQLDQALAAAPVERLRVALRPG